MPNAPFTWGNGGPQNLQSPAAGIVTSDSSGNYTSSTTGSNNQVLTADSSNTKALTYAYPTNKNYLTNPTFESTTTTGWTLGTVTVTSGLPTGAPTFGSGASGSLVLSNTSSSPNAGSRSLSYAMTGNSIAGDFVASSAFTIDNEDQAKVLTFKFSYSIASGSANTNFSGTSSNSFGVAIYDVTNSAWIIPAGVFNLVQTTGVGISTGTFQTTSNSTSYRLVVYNATASTGSFTMVFDSFLLGPQTSPMAPAMSDWVSYTPTTQGFGAPTITEAYWMRIGGSLFTKGRMTLGTNTGVEARIGIPFTISSSIETSTAIYGSIAQGGTAQIIPLATGGNTYFTLANQSAGTAFTNINGSGLSNASTLSWIVGPIPISGWSSNSVASSDTDTRVISAGYWVSTNFSASTTIPINFDSKDFDTNAAVTTSATSWKFSAPVTGYYFVSVMGAANANTNLIIYKNGSAFKALATNNANYVQATGTAIVSLVAGDYIDIRPTGSVTYTGGTLATGGITTININRLSGPAVITATESVNARYYASATSISGSLATVSWTTKDFDSHNAMSSGIYTIPVTGKYQVNTALALAGTFALNNQSNMVIQKNSVTVSELLDYAGGAETADHVFLSDTISCIAGDTIRVQVSSGATAPSIVSSNTKNYISISRVGN